MKIILITISLILAGAACRDAVGPVEGNTPEGPFVIWFNGLSNFADAYFIQSDSLMTNAWSTGEAPNQIAYTGNNRFAVLSSLSSDIQYYSIDNTGSPIATVVFPSGSNPWSFTVSDGTGYAALLLSDCVAVFDESTFDVTSNIPTESNPSGIACSDSMLFVGHASYPDASSPGGVSVIDIDSGELLKWIDTGLNTHWLKLQPSGMLHCYSTTYQNDGKITVVNPITMETETVIQCGGAPGEGIQFGSEYLSPDGWGSGGVVKYTESGQFSIIDTPVSTTNLAIYGNRIYATSFAANRVYILDAETFSLIDSLSSGGQGPQGIIAIDPSN